MTPNPSVEARPNGKPTRPPPGVVYHPSGGRVVLPSVPPHLERWAAQADKCHQTMSSKDSWSVPSRESIPSLTHDQLTEHIRLANVNVGHYANVREALDAELQARSPIHNYKCMKCGHSSYQVAQFRAAQGGMGSFFGVESAQYQGIVCARCKFTEFYQGTVPAGQQALDFLFGG